MFVKTLIFPPCILYILITEKKTDEHNCEKKGCIWDTRMVERTFLIEGSLGHAIYAFGRDCFMVTEEFTCPIS